MCGNQEFETIRIDPGTAPIWGFEKEAFFTVAIS
jgi:hypothetical protein